MPYFEMVDDVGLTAVENRLSHLAFSAFPLLRLYLC